MSRSFESSFCFPHPIIKKTNEVQKKTVNLNDSCKGGVIQKCT